MMETIKTSAQEYSSEEMLLLDRYLTELKAEADALYEDTEVYGIAGWGNESARNTGLYEFCAALPKGAELHAHEMTLLPFERYVEIVRRDAWILLENSVTVEVCPTSNLALGYVHDLRIHPALYYLNNGVPIVICSDDGLFMTPRPLVDDFYSAVLCWDLSIDDIREICERSIRAGGLSEEETDHLLQVWRRSWNDFCGEQLKAIQDRSTS